MGSHLRHDPFQWSEVSLVVR